MKYVSNDRGALPVLVIIFGVALVGVVALAVYNVNKSNQNNVQTVDASPSPAGETASPVATPTPSPASDQEWIVQAVRAYNSQSANDTVTGIAVVGSNAKGNGATPGAPSGYQFIAHKDGGIWKVVFRGQEKPGKALGEQYGLPADWYSTAY